MKGDKNMDYKTMRDRIEDMINDNHKDFVKAVISMEKGINDESALDKLYDAYMDNDTINLLHEEFDYMIEDLKEQGQIKDLPYVQEEKDNLINIVGNIIGNVDVVEREKKNGEAFSLQHAFSFYIVFKEGMLAVEHKIGELPYPVAENKHTCFAIQRQVELYVPVSINKVVYVFVRLHIVPCVLHQILFLFAKKRKFLSVYTFQPALLCPFKSQLHAPPRVKEVQQSLAGTVMEYAASNCPRRRLSEWKFAGMAVGDEVNAGDVAFLVKNSGDRCYGSNMSNLAYL